MERARARRNARHRRLRAFGEWNHDGDSSWPAAATTFFDLTAAHKPPETETKRKSGAYATRKSCFTVVPKAVDDDLHRVPSDIFYQKPARKRGWLRFLLMAGCFCPGGANTA